MKNYFYRFIVVFLSSFPVLLALSLVMNFPAGGDIATVLPGAAAILTTTFLSSVICAFVSKSASIRLVIFTQFLAIFFIFLIYFII